MNNISFIIPVYNIEVEKIDRCFKSIYSQIKPTDEIIFIDDGSTGEIANFLDTLIKNNVHVIHQENGGTASARNKGLDKASKEWIIFVDPDDWIKENSIEKVRKSFDSNNDMYIYDYYGTSDCKNIKKYTFFTMDNVSKEDIYRNLLNDRYYTNGVDGIIGCGVPWAHAYKKSFLVNCNLRFDPKFKREEDNFFTMYATDKTDNIEIVHYAFYIYWSEHCFTYFKTFKRNTLDYIPLEAKEKMDFHYKEDMSKELYTCLIRFNYSCIMILLNNYILNRKVKDSKQEKKKYLEFMKGYEAFKLVYGGTKYLSLKQRSKLFMYRSNLLWMLQLEKDIKTIIKKILIRLKLYS